MKNIKLILFTAFFVIILLLILAYLVYSFIVPTSVKSTITSVTSGNIIDILPKDLKSKMDVLSTLTPDLINKLKDIAEKPESVIPKSLKPLLDLNSDQMNNLVSVASR